MAAPAPAAPAPAVKDAPAAKRQRLATTETTAWAPPEVTHTWTIEDLTLASFTGAASTDKWLGPIFQACGLRWRLFVMPNREPANEEPVICFGLRLLSRTSAPVELAVATLAIRGVTKHTIVGSFYTGDVQRFPDGQPQCCHVLGFTIKLADLARNADSVLADGKMVISVTMRSRSFCDLVVPTPSAPTLPALIAAALPSSGSELAAGVDVVFKAAGERIGAHSLILALRSSTLRASLVALGAPRSEPRSERVAASRAGRSRGL